MTEPYERAFVGRVEYIRRWCGTLGEQHADVGVAFGGRRNEITVLGDGSEWAPGQRVDVILRAVHEPKAEEVQDAD